MEAEDKMGTKKFSQAMITEMIDYERIMDALGGAQRMDSCSQI